MASARQTEFSFVAFIAETGKWRMLKGGGMGGYGWKIQGGTFPGAHVHFVYPLAPYCP